MKIGDVVLFDGRWLTRVVDTVQYNDGSTRYDVSPLDAPGLVYKWVRESSLDLIQKPLDKIKH